MIVFRNLDKIPKFMKNYEIMMSGDPVIHIHTRGQGWFTNGATHESI